MKEFLEQVIGMLTMIYDLIPNFWFFATIKAKVLMVIDFLKQLAGNTAAMEDLEKKHGMAVPSLAKYEAQVMASMRGPV